MAGTVLYVVDMQPGFDAAGEIIDEVIREINLARRRKDYIIFVELDVSTKNRTYGQLTNAAHKDGYCRISYLNKSCADGSSEFLAETKRLNLKYKRIRVCGVNRNQCVMRTVDGFIDSTPETVRIEVAKAATANSCGRKEWDDNEHPEKAYAILSEQHGVVLKP